MTERELHGARELSKRIGELELHLALLRRRLTETTKLLDGLPKSTPPEPRIERILAVLLDEERELESCRQRLLIEAAKLTREICLRVDKTLIREILLLRYVDCKSFRQIARELDISERTTFRLHRSGIAKLAVAWQ